MINSRSLDELLPVVKLKVEDFLALAKYHDVDLLVTSTYRDIESQNALYRQGRGAAGRIVTNAKGGESFHNWRCAVDVVPIVNGKAVWNDNTLWKMIGEFGEEAGLEWAGRWKNIKEFPHFQYTNNLTIAQLNAGVKIT